MPRLPRISGRQAVSAFERAGFHVRRQRGSHIIMTRPGFPETLSIPDHRELKTGTPRALIRKAGLSVERFEELLAR
jgi:predicted RNA binding protein YcfA (HicA-like mRNA interferase family)